MSKAKKSKTEDNRPKILNRRARFDYEILDKMVAGIVLTGTEVKSIRASQTQLNEAFVRIDKKAEAYLYGMTIAHYKHGSLNNHDPNRIRKLLLNKREIERWKSKVEQERLTIIPLKIFFKGPYIKLEIALAKRKLKHDKRKTLKAKAIEKDLARELKQ